MLCFLFIKIVTLFRRMLIGVIIMQTLIYLELFEQLQIKYLVSSFGGNGGRGGGDNSVRVLII